MNDRRCRMGEWCRMEDDIIMEEEDQTQTVSKAIRPNSAQKRSIGAQQFVVPV
jgi:hypothetical protein